MIFLPAIFITAWVAACHCKRLAIWREMEVDSRLCALCSKSFWREVGLRTKTPVGGAKVFIHVLFKEVTLQNSCPIFLH